MYLKDEALNEDMLNEYITEFYKGEPLPKLPKGNYLIVNFVKNKLNITEYTVDDLYYRIIPSEQFKLCLYNTSGANIENAIVKCGSKTLKYNKSTKTYNSKVFKTKKVLEINNNGVYHYIEIENQHYSKYKKNIFKSAWYNIKRGIISLFKANESLYTGFIVFNKPKYKPGETVKLKAYITDYDGNPYNKEVNFRILGYYIDSLLVKLKPYRPGMYEYEFKLSDSLNLNLDTRYSIIIRTQDKNTNSISNNFSYEDYELKSINFSISTNKDEYKKDDTVKITLKATDENNMAVYGGKVNVIIRPYYFQKSNIGKKEFAFIPDTLWKYTVNLDNTSEKGIIIPDSVFLPDLSFNYLIECTYLSTDNEKRVQNKKLYRQANDYNIDFLLKNGILNISKLYKNKSQNVNAIITAKGANHNLISIDTVTLPHSMPLPWTASSITVETQHATGNYKLNNVKPEDIINCQFYKQNDSIYLKVKNPANIPFWYTIRKSKKNIKNGFTTQLDWVTKDVGKDGYNMDLFFILGEKNQNIKKNIPFINKNISINVTTPTVVYPGQKANVLVSVTDLKGNPIQNADVTAYSFTSKFDYSMPYIPVFYETNYAKGFKYISYKNKKSSIVNKKADMNWYKWKTTMALDTIEYYNFLYPESYYIYKQPTTDGSTQISPYIVNNGALQGVHMLWIDDILYYTSKSQQFNVYTFNIEPGIHDLRFRTHDKEIIVHNMFIEKGVKNIISFNANKPYIQINNKNDNSPATIVSKQLPEKERGYLTDYEVDELTSSLILIDNNSGKLQLPNLSKPIDIPMYIKAGNNFYYLNYKPRNTFNKTLKAHINSPILAGPFPKRYILNGMTDIAHVYNEGNLITNIEIIGGNRYTLYKNYQKINNWGQLPFNRNISDFTPQTNFKEEPLTSNKIRQYHYRYLYNTLSNNKGIATLKTKTPTKKENKCNLNLYLGKNKKGINIKPTLILITPENNKDTSNYLLYYGGTRTFKNLPSGKNTITLVFNSTTVYSKKIELYPNGQNYLNLDSIEYEKNNETAKTALHLFDKFIKKQTIKNPYLNTNEGKDSIIFAPMRKLGKYNSSNASKGIITGTVTDSIGNPLSYILVVLKGTNIGTLTDSDGRFELPSIPYNEIVFSHIEYITKSVKYYKGFDYKINLNKTNLLLDEDGPILTAYGTSRERKNYKYPIEEIAEHCPPSFVKETGNITIRGISHINNLNNSLIILNGLPFNGDIGNIDPNDIESINVLKDADAITLYGAQAANGVIIIKTKVLLTLNQNNESTGIEVGNTMRRNFHDDAFWQPSLKTNEKGEASFEVTYPDDITSWNAYFIAIGNKKQIEKKQLTINSFKSLTARLSTPRFAIQGDSLNAIGRIMNYLKDSIQIERLISIDEQKSSEKLKIAELHVDYITTKVKSTDSLKIAYSLQMENGYFDGEERTIPIFKKGMLETHGEFKVINDTLTHTFNINPTLGETIIHADISSIKTFLDELNIVEQYPYMCNEQMGSKIKALLAKKYLYQILDKEFNDDKKVKSLIKQLNKNKNTNGLWGWWNKDKTEFWISKHIIEALLDAESAGYKININKDNLCNIIENELKYGLSNIELTNPEKIPLAKQELLDRLIMLKRLNASIEYEYYLNKIDNQLESKTITDKLKTMYTMSIIGLAKKINIDTLMRYSNETLLGSLYWGNDKKTATYYPMNYLLPCDNNTDNTLMAYTILKNMAGYEKELEKIRNYFFELRQNGAWQNIYASTKIVETIISDMIVKEKEYKKATLFINNKEVTKFPYTEKFNTKNPIKIKKQGTEPLFVTTYQKEWNKNPQTESSKGFIIKTHFSQNKDTVLYLKEGKVTNLEILVDINANAKYVQIEVPIPAGCTYDSKPNYYFFNEVHREYFKEKVIIFCNNLNKGKHQFSIELIPRFTGFYSLNPSKVELMYFPSFYGNEDMKMIKID